MCEMVCICVMECVCESVCDGMCICDDVCTCAPHLAEQGAEEGRARKEGGR